jgi:N-acetylmuramoyl-L-alanine amidase
MTPDLPPPAIEDLPLPYEERLDTRPLAAIEGIVIHCTETPDLASARDFGERVLYASGTGNSGHYYIDRDGQVLRYVAMERVAHHVRGYNATTIGIELVNRGRYPRWYDSDHQHMNEPYPEPQIAALLQLLAQLRTELPNVSWIAGHEDLDTEQVPANDDPGLRIARKRDPGPLFPWPRVLDVVKLERMGG